MKLINKTEFDTVYLRKVIVWVRDQVGLRPDWITQLTFKPSRRRSWSWRMDGSHHATIMIKRNSNGDSLAWALGYVFGYMAQKQDGVRYARGPVRAKTASIHAEFSQGMNAKLHAASMPQDTMDMLCAKAGVEGFDLEPVKPNAKLKATPVQRRAKKAQADLARWERKLKLAKGKVAKLQRRVAYYAKNSSTPHEPEI
jgi:hypothetical protein